MTPPRKKRDEDAPRRLDEPEREEQDQPPVPDGPTTIGGSDPEVDYF